MPPPAARPPASVSGALPSSTGRTPGGGMVGGRAWEPGDGVAGGPARRPSPAGPAYAAARGATAGLVQRGAAVLGAPDERREGPRLAARMTGSGAAALAPTYPF